MMRGKDDEKVMGPMFPRLHVNDTEKGGPRAPPRNKMALYEQLSIPSQRFKPGVVPVNPNNTSDPASSSQGNGQQRNIFYSHPLPPSRQAVEKLASHYYDSSASFMPPDQKKHSEEDDFMVPIFMHSHDGQDRGKPFPASPATTEHSIKHLTNSNNEPRQILAIGPDIRQEGRNQNKEKLREFAGVREQSVKAVPNSSSVDKVEVALRQADTSLCHNPSDSTANNSSRLLKADQPLIPEHRVKSRVNSRVLGDAAFDEPTTLTNNGNSVSVYDFHSEDQRILDDSESREDKTCGYLPTIIADRDDDASETSMVDSISGLDISPDDVVGIIGQKHFWKARRAIVNQQRVFAVQIFELHRLVKVQRLIAGSPQLLVENSTPLGKPIKGSSSKKLPVEYVVKAIPNGSKPKNDSEKLNHKIECSAENNVGKASLSSVQNGSQLPSYKPVSVNSPAAAATGDHTTGSWCFHQPQGHQWLIPVFSPSEGLVYKPYPGPGFMSAACGGCGPPGSTPVMGSFLPPAYGVPSAHHYQGMGVPPFAAPPGPQGYFPPYGMAVMNQGITGSGVDQMTHFAASGLHGQPPPGLVANHNIQRQNSSNVRGHKYAGIADVMKFQASRDSELQISTASSPSEKVQGSVRRGNTTEGSSVLPLFPTSPVVEAPSQTQPQELDHPAQVIKVVPRNGISATESVARIFQFIQEERKTL